MSTPPTYTTPAAIRARANALGVLLAPPPTEEEAEAAGVMATGLVDTRFTFAGSKTGGDAQGLEFPRAGLLGLDTYPRKSAEVPDEIRTLTADVAVSILRAEVFDWKATEDSLRTAGLLAA